MAIPEGERCCESVVDHTGFNFFQCERRGTTERDGTPYCWQHDPVSIKKRQDEKTAEHDATIARETKRWNRDDACRKACEGISTDSLTPGLVRELVATLGLFEQWRSLLGMTTDIFTVSISHYQLEVIIEQLDSIRFEE